MSDKNREKIFIIEEELKENPYKVFEVAFAMTSVIPFLAFFAILVGELFDLDILIGRIGGILTTSILISIIGYYTGYRVISNLLDKIIVYAAKVKHDDEVKTTFVASVSHELRNPLTIIKTNLYNMRTGVAGEVNEGQKEIINVCYESIDRISRLVSNLLDLYRLEAGMVKLQARECDFAALARKLFREYEAILRERGMNTSLEVGDGAGRILCDEDKITQVLDNLISNAVKYSPGGGTVTIRSLREPDGIRIECEDTGVGVPQDKLEKIFSRFERLDTKEKGYGLGLAIVRNLVELHGGRVWAENKAEKGTRLVVTIPFNLGQGGGKESGTKKEKNDPHNRR